jgi:hypothetical protein
MANDDTEWLEETRAWWRDIIYNPDGTLNEDAILAELSDFKFMIEEVPKVYSEITGGMLSKPNYHASGVLQAHEEHLEELIAEMQHEVAREVIEMLEAGHTKDDILKEYPCVYPRRH